MLKQLVLGISALAATFTALPSAAQAGGRHRHHGYEQQRYYDGYGYDDRYYDRRQYRRGYDDRYYDRRQYRRGYDDRYYGRRAYRSRYDDRGYYGRRRCGSGTTGLIIGGAGGALLGREIGRGGRGYYGRRRGSGTTGAILGGAVGALVGREIARSC